MANPEAVNRMAQAAPKPPMSPPDDMGAPPAAPDAPSGPKDGVDGLVETLKGVGSFLQSQGPGAQEAMGHFQALLQSMAKMGGDAPGGAPEAPAGSPPGAPPATDAPKGNGRLRMDSLPGTQVL